MKLELGTSVHTTDGSVGELADVVVDPAARRVTHLVVKPEHHDRARLVPASLASAGDDETTIELDATAEELHGLPQAEEVAYLRLGEFPVDDPDWDVGIEHVLAPAYYDYEGLSPTAFDPHVVMTYDRIPKGRVEIRRSSAVLSADEHHLGHVEGLLVDADDRITHVVLERGHLFGRRDVTIPIGSVTRVETDSITLDLTKDEVGRLPAVPVR